MRKLAGMILAFVLVIFASACGTEKPAETGTAAAAGQETEASAETQDSADPSRFAGEYVFYGTYLNEHFVMIEDLKGTSTILKEDGTGFLEWGEANRKAVKEWKVTGNSIRISTEDATITGIVEDGVLMLEIGEVGSSFAQCFVTEDADTSRMPQITAEEWAEMVAETIE